jgi:hypothetical protein
MTTRFRLFVLLLVAALAAGVAPAAADDTPAGSQDAATATLQEPEAEESFAGLGALHIATLLARHFDLFDFGDEDATLTPSEAADLFDLGVGFGALFKLYAYTAVTPEDDAVEDLIPEGCRGEDDGECEIGWGELRKSLTEEQLTALDAFPKNLGGLISADRRGHGRPDHAASLLAEHAAASDSDDAEEEALDELGGDDPGDDETGDTPGPPAHARSGGHKG